MSLQLPSDPNERKVPYEILRDGMTLDIRVMTDSEKERYQQTYPKLSCVPLKGTWINAPEQ